MHCDIKRKGAHLSLLSVASLRTVFVYVIMHAPAAWFPLDCR